MGRKIPAKKHRGVKDPVKQQQQRFNKIKTKINAPPTDPDDQPVPRSVTQLFAHRDQKNKDNKKKSKPFIGVAHNGIEKKKVSRKKNPVNQLKQLPGESAREFSRRINSAVKSLSEPDELLQYPGDVEEEDVKGARMAEERERRRIKHQKREKAANAAGKETKEGTAEKNKNCRLALKKAAKKAKAAEMSAERSEVQYERVGFGEVADAPPALSLPRRATACDGAPRPGSRELLLTKLLNPALCESSKSGNVASSAAFSNSLGAAERQRRERARLDAVAAYRKLKKQSAT